MTEVLIIFAHQFGDFQDYHISFVKPFANVLADVSSDGNSDDIDEELLSFFKCLDVFQDDLDISRSREGLVDSLAVFCRKYFTLDKAFSS